MKLSELLQLVDKEWHGQFLHFIETGEADDKFLEHLNADRNTQTAVEDAFGAQAAAFEGLAQAISAEPLASEHEDRTQVSTAMSNAIEDVVDLPPLQRKEAIQQVATALKSSARQDRAKDVQSVVRDLQEAVALAE
jgi:hypothetical protein